MMVTGWVLWALASLATAAPLMLNDVLTAVDARVPQLAAVEAKLQEAEGKLLGSRGAFDPVFSGKLGAYGGKEPRNYGDAALMLPTILGPDLELSYGIGIGDFPFYDTDRETEEGGEVRARVNVPLLDGLILPEGRANLQVARAGVDAATADQSDKRVQIRLKATETYWKWVAAGAKLTIEQELLRQVETRNSALQLQVEQGTRARLDLLDNQRALLLRRDAVARAQRDFETAGLALSLWYRDARGERIVPSADQVPVLAPAERPLPPLDEDHELVDRRPDLRRIEARIDAARTERARAANALLPDLDLKGEAIQPVSPDGEAELFAGASLKLPTLSRKERGKVASARARVDRLGEERRGVRDGARAELEAARVAIAAAWQRVQWTQEAQELALEVVRLERRRFQVGGGDIFQLLVRESNLAKAQKESVNAAFDHEVAVAVREAALGR